MAAVTLTPADLAPFADIEQAKADEMIADALALATRVAPCIVEPDFEHAAAAKAVIRRAILRWNDAGSGAVTQRGAGPFQETVDNRQPHRSLFWPSEINELQDLCRENTGAKAYTVDMVGIGSVHAEACSINFGANYCSCGADIAGFPLWELE